MRFPIWSLLAVCVAGASLGCTASADSHATGSGESGTATGGARGSGGSAASSGGASGASGGSAGQLGGTGGRAAMGSGGTTAGSGGTTGVGGAVACSSPLASRVRITETDVGVMYGYNEVDNNGAALGLTPLALSPIPGGGSRLAFLGKTDSMVHVLTFDAADQPVAGTAFALPAFDFQDIYADATGGVLLVSRAALGSTLNHNCGDINNLCGLVANYPTAASCDDLYMVRFDGTTETWATKLTDTSATLPAYGVSATTGNDIIFIWSEYAHNGRIAFDGANYGAYFGVAITAPGQACVGDSTRTSGVNIHQGDRMKLVSGAGALQTGGFSVGCSHSGFERVIWDPTARKFVGVCKNDAPTGTKSGRLAFPGTTTIEPVDLSYSNLGNVMMAGGGGYWIISSDIRAGQPANADGLADVHLLHVPSTAVPTPDSDVTLVSDGQNDRAPHLTAYGASQLLAAWEESTATGDLRQTDAARQMYVQIIDAATGAPPAGSSPTTAGPLKLTPNVLGSRYQDFRAFPDGSAAYPAPGTSATKIKILRVLPCAG